MSDEMERIESLEKTVEEMKKTIAAFKIDRQLMIEREKKLKPGMATKVAYNSDGLITGSQPLEPSDIPTIPISKVKGLEEHLSNSVSTDQIKSIKQRLDGIYANVNTVKTGTKVNVDEHGLVTDVADMTPDDLPNIPIIKVDGLLEALSTIKTEIPIIKEEPRIQAGSGCKVEYDNMGHVTKASPLTEEDIPHTILTRIKELNSLISSLASAKDVNILREELLKKQDQIQTHSGTYSKVRVNSNGQVVGGSELTREDLPELTIADIKGLKEELTRLALHDDLIALKNEVAQLNSNITNVLNPTRTVEKKFNQDVEEIKAELNAIKSDTSIDDELADIKSQLASILAQLNIISK